MVRKVIRGCALAALLAAGVMARPVPAVSQAPINCANRSEVVEFLARQYREKPAATALINPQAIMEVYAADNGSWTLIVTDVNGAQITYNSPDSEVYGMLAAAPGVHADALAVIKRWLARAVAESR